ncbi:hypothetical protein MMC30_005719 [Trapelia coarctata]|nr:hypothetical protein [Trapelia coarctata]
MARGPLTVETRRLLKEEDSNWTIKALARVLAAIFAAIALVLFAVSVSLTNQNFDNTSGNGDWSDGLAIAPAALSLLTNIVTLILLPLRSGRPLHPAIHLLSDFLIWALAVPSIIFATAGGLFWYWSPAIANANGEIDCAFFFNAWAEVCEPVAYTIGHVEIAGLVMMFGIFVMHIALFAFACVDMHQWRVNRKNGDKVEKGSFELQYSKDMERGSL